MKNEIFAFCAGFIFCLFIKFAFKLGRKVLSDNGNRIDTDSGRLNDSSERIARASDAIEHASGIIEEVRKRSEKKEH